MWLTCGYGSENDSALSFPLLTVDEDVCTELPCWLLTSDRLGDSELQDDMKSHFPLRCAGHLETVTAPLEIRY